MYPWLLEAMVFITYRPLVVSIGYFGQYVSSDTDLMKVNRSGNTLLPDYCINLHGLSLLNE